MTGVDVIDAVSGVTEAMAAVTAAIPDERCARAASSATESEGFEGVSLVSGEVCSTCGVSDALATVPNVVASATFGACTSTLASSAEIGDAGLDRLTRRLRFGNICANRDWTTSSGGLEGHWLGSSKTACRPVLEVT
jgi:hypothetical protein